MRRKRSRSRPYYSQFPNLAAINEVQSVANGHFNGLLGSVRTTNFHGFTTKLSYTLGHSMDDLSYARDIIPQNSYCLRCDYGNSDFDIRNSFSMFLTYALPQPAKYRALLGGWQLNTLFSFFTGTPFTVLFRQRFQRHGRVRRPGRGGRQPLLECARLRSSHQYLLLVQSGGLRGAHSRHLRE